MERRYLRRSMLGVLLVLSGSLVVAQAKPSICAQDDGTKYYSDRGCPLGTTIISGPHQPQMTASAPIPSPQQRRADNLQDNDEGIGKVVESSSPKEAHYVISEDTRKGNAKRSVVVTLEDKVSEDELGRLAMIIKNRETREYQRTFIGYYLKNEDRNNGYFATTNFNPNLEVRILGLSMESERALKGSRMAQSDTNVVGVWLDERPGVAARLTLYRSGDKLLLESAYSDGSSGIEEMIEVALEDGMRVENKEGNDFGEYYVINKAGHLECWSRNGKYYTTGSRLK